MQRQKMAAFDRGVEICDLTGDAPILPAASEATEEKATEEPDEKRLKTGEPGKEDT